MAEKLGDLDPRIDARETDVPSDEWGGFHRIEQALWIRNTTEGQGRYADQLAADARELQRKVEETKLRPGDLVTGSVELLNEVSSSKITGEEERYSHLDLLDISANVEGSRAAFEAIKPAVRKEDPALARRIEDRFREVEQDLSQYRRGDGWASYEKLSRDERRDLSQKIDALAEPLSRVGEALED